MRTTLALKLKEGNSSFPWSLIFPDPFHDNIWFSRWSFHPDLNLCCTFMEADLCWTILRFKCVLHLENAYETWKPFVLWVFKVIRVSSKFWWPWLDPLPPFFRAKRLQVVLSETDRVKVKPQLKITEALKMWVSCSDHFCLENPD